MSASSSSLSTVTSRSSSPSPVSSKVTSKSSSSSKPPVTSSSSSKPPVTSTTPPASSKSTTLPTNTSTITSPAPKVLTSTILISTTIVTTELNGNIETEVVNSTKLTLQTQSSKSNGVSRSSSKVATIAGGAAGGALCMLILILAILLILRKRKRQKNPNGNPGGTTTKSRPTPEVDLITREVESFLDEVKHPLKGSSDQSAPMVQRPGVPTVGGEGSDHRNSDIYSSIIGPHSPATATGQSVTGLHNTDFRGPSPGPSLRTSGTHFSYKERDSAGDWAGLQIASEEGGSGRRGSDAVQHMHAGRLQQQSIPEELPSNYHSTPDNGGRA